MNAFCYLKYGLAGILTYVGVKMILAESLHIPVLGSLLIIIAILSVAIVASLIKNKGTKTCAVIEETKTCPALKSLEGAESAEASAADETCPGLKRLAETESEKE
jgi:tellurite resistance protein TerC